VLLVATVAFHEIREVFRNALTKRIHAVVIQRLPAKDRLVRCFVSFANGFLQSVVTAFVVALIWHVGALRFLVAMGVGGEWAVGAALVAEVFPSMARERASGIFHATSVVGLWLAAGVGLAVASNWRVAYLVGIVPALLVLWVRTSVREPETWQTAKSSHSDQLGSFRALLGNPQWRSRAIFGALLMTPVICWVPFYFQSFALMLCLLPIFGFFAQGIHAGYAIYFPELFPTHLRATGAGFCFNTGRILATPVLIWGSAEMKRILDLRWAITWLGCLFLPGPLILPFLPETRGKELPT
jgi:MFS family permease